MQDKEIKGPYFMRPLVLISTEARLVTFLIVYCYKWVSKTPVNDSEVALYFSEAEKKYFSVGGPDMAGILGLPSVSSLVSNLDMLSNEASEAIRTAGYLGAH